MSGFLVAEEVSHGPITLGTMRMLEIERSNREWVEHLRSVHDLGIRTLHSSVEYDSFPLLSTLLDEFTQAGGSRQFRHIVKLGEPSFDDATFDAGRLQKKVRDYCTALSVSGVDDVQWMWREGLKDDQRRISQFQAQLDQIAVAAGNLKRNGLLKRFFCFPYSVEFGRVALEHPSIDGLVVYRNREETEYDRLIDRADMLSKRCHVIRPFKAGSVLDGGQRSAAEALVFALDKPAIESAILSTNSLDHLRQLAAAAGITS
jgi:hypothetical protein